MKNRLYREEVVDICLDCAGIAQNVWILFGRVRDRGGPAWREVSVLSGVTDRRRRPIVLDRDC